MDKNLRDILETVNFIKDHMLMKAEGLTKDELPKLVRPIIREELAVALKPIEDRLTSVESKIAGTDRCIRVSAQPRNLADQYGMVH